jgi:hypothetical protein
MTRPGLEATGKNGLSSSYSFFQGKRNISELQCTPACSANFCNLLAQWRFFGGKLEEDRGCIRGHFEDSGAIAKLQRKAD